MLKFAASFLTVASLLIGVAENLPSKAVYAKSYIVMEATTGRVISAANEHERLPMASTTKIMTALIALEQPDVYRYFEVDSNAIRVEGTSMGLQSGFSANLYGLSAGMLLPSGNDGANAAAVQIDGSIERFAERMNKRAQKIGMVDTNFVTPSGLHNENHYSSAYDMALLARTALKNPLFASICGSAAVTVEVGNPPQNRTYQNHNKLLTTYEGCIGVKTGFTKKAGRCLVSAAERDGVKLICVTLGASDDWNCHKLLLDDGFSQVKPSELVMDVDLSKLSINVVGGEAEKLSVATQGQTLTCIDEADVGRIKSRVFLDKFYYAPVKVGDVVGEIRHYLDDSEIATTTLVAAKGTEQSSITKKPGLFGK